MHANIIRLIPLALLASQAAALKFGKRQDDVPSACTDQCASFVQLAEQLNNNQDVSPELLQSICTAETASQYQACFSCSVENGADAAAITYAASALESGCQVIGSPIPPFVVGGQTVSPSLPADTGSASSVPSGTGVTTPSATRSTTPTTTPTTSPRASTSGTAATSGTPAPSSTPAAASQIQVHTSLLGGLLVAALAFVGAL